MKYLNLKTSCYRTEYFKNDLEKGDTSIQSESTVVSVQARMITKLLATCKGEREGEEDEEPCYLSGKGASRQQVLDEIRLLSTEPDY